MADQQQVDLEAQVNRVDPDEELLQSEDNLSEEISDLPQEITESYGTGVKESPTYNLGRREMKEELDEYATYTSPELTGGDVDAGWQQAAMDGDEAVGGTASTPDQDIVDEIGAAVGIEMNDAAFLRTSEMLEQRDDSRWELDPKSSEDYGDRRE
ncbi:DUF6335 family protein [Plectonema radiosum NIES-515]|uniref:DUF6335 family protein n=1 Tax=Plectonema radiosum NIES-515 TaxID=2986073 RepID=A0ABT3AVF7_9CYAN|nr:DUF6335 family protein [Plectonema radiosum]MCV3213118.1 DUF6335 family protein [Plectonema radiosum NIES-515]